MVTVMFNDNLNNLVSCWIDIEDFGVLGLSDGRCFINPTTDGHAVTLLQTEEEQVFGFRSVC